MPSAWVPALPATEALLKKERAGSTMLLVTDMMKVSQLDLSSCSSSLKERKRKEGREIV